MNQSNFALGTT